MPPPTKEPTAAVIKAYDLVLWLVPKVEGFPRSHRFTIGDRLVSAGLDLLLSLVQASYALAPVPAFHRLNDHAVRPIRDMLGTQGIR